jgi:hypothetical protein
MINPILKHGPATNSWVPSPWLSSPGRLIDRFIDKFLDYIEHLSSLVVPAQADIPSYAKAKIEARVERFGA